VATLLGLGPAPAGAVEGSGVVAVGAAPDAGSLLGRELTRPVNGIASTATGEGYWMVADDGGIFAFGDAPFFGSTGDIVLNRPMVGMAPTTSGAGYWMFAGDGGIFAFGDAPFFGSTGDVVLNAPIVGMATTATDAGYWLVGADGGVFTFGDAPFVGSLGADPPEDRIVALEPLRKGVGYWLLTEGGDVVAFGDAQDLGDLGAETLPAPVVGMAASATGQGYWLALADGSVYAYGDADPALTSGPRCLTQPVADVAARPQADGLWLATVPLPPVDLRGLGPLAQLDRESADITRRLDLGQACQAPTPAAQVRLRHPLPGSSVTDPFGSRTHPIYRVPQLHRGIDLAGGTNAIRAAAAGTVVEVGTRVGYGRVTVIDHGGRVATLYAHQRSTSVQAGDTVQAGQVIGQVGATGFATGPHLHFEVRLDGEVVNPARWLGV